MRTGLLAGGRQVQELRPTPQVHVAVAREGLQRRALSEIDLGMLRSDHDGVGVEARQRDDALAGSDGTVGDDVFAPGDVLVLRGVGQAHRTATIAAQLVPLPEHQPRCARGALEEAHIGPAAHPDVAQIDEVQLHAAERDAHVAIEAERPLVGQQHSVHLDILTARDDAELATADLHESHRIDHRRADLSALSDADVVTGHVLREVHLLQQHPALAERQDAPIDLVRGDLDGLVEPSGVGGGGAAARAVDALFLEQLQIEAGHRRSAADVQREDQVVLGHGVEHQAVAARGIGAEHVQEAPAVVAAQAVQRRRPQAGVVEAVEPVAADREQRLVGVQMPDRAEAGPLTGDAQVERHQGLRGGGGAGVEVREQPGDELPRPQADGLPRHRAAAVFEDGDARDAGGEPLAHARAIDPLVEAILQQRAGALDPARVLALL